MKKQCILGIGTILLVCLPALGGVVDLTNPYAEFHFWQSEWAWFDGDADGYPGKIKIGFVALPQALWISGAKEVDLGAPGGSGNRGTFGDDVVVGAYPGRVMATAQLVAGGGSDGHLGDLN
jgi:hypothetical protein